ncbi:hypothetical protein STEG23_015582, partial [Scotinomys teguina]
MKVTKKRVKSALADNLLENGSPLTKVKLINELNEREVQLGVSEKVSWHSEYKDSAWIFLGGLPYELTEGDIICVFSQYGEIVNINLVRDKKTGKSKGFCFLCYEDQRSTVLAVDNFNGIKIKGRTIRVDHVSNYRAPQESEDVDDVTRELQEKGCGAITPSSSSPEVSEDEDVKPTKKHKKDKKEKKRRKKEKEKTEHKVQGEPPSCSLSSSSRTAKEKDEPKKYSSRDAEKAQKSESREGRQKHAGSPDVRSSFHDRAEDSEWEPKREKPKHEHKSSSRREREERSRERDRERSSVRVSIAVTTVTKKQVGEERVYLAYTFTALFIMKGGDGSGSKGNEDLEILALDLENTFNGTDDFFVTSDIHLEVSEMVYKCPAQPSSEKLPPAADENKYIEPQLDIMKRVRDLGTLRVNAMSPSTLSPQGSVNPVEEEAERVYCTYTVYLECK